MTLGDMHIMRNVKTINSHVGTSWRLPNIFWGEWKWGWDESYYCVFIFHCSTILLEAKRMIHSYSLLFPPIHFNSTSPVLNNSFFSRTSGEWACIFLLWTMFLFWASVWEGIRRSVWVWKNVAIMRVVLGTSALETHRAVGIREASCEERYLVIEVQKLCSLTAYRAKALALLHSKVGCPHRGHTH